MIENRQKILLIQIISVLIAMVIAWMPTLGVLRNVERLVSDSMYQIDEKTNPNIKIIAIDDETIYRIGTSSEWNREYFAKVIEFLNKDEAKSPKVIGVDVVFSGSNGTGNNNSFQSTIQKYNNIIMACVFTFDEHASDSRYGFVNVKKDNDGYVRHAYTYMEIEADDAHVREQSFAYRIASSYGKVNSYPSYVQFAYAGKPGEFDVVSMVDVLDGKVPDDYFAGSIVLIGSYADGLNDSHKVPVDYSKEMFGVELQANIIQAFLNDYIVYDIDEVLQFFITVIILSFYLVYTSRNGIRNSAVMLIVVIVGYLCLVNTMFSVASIKMNVLAVSLGAVGCFGISVMYKYFMMQRSSIIEMRETLFSMAEAMSEAVEGRTPYNANHTKNVARRCVELVQYINKQYKKKRTRHYFTKSEIQQLYLAAMLHDVGKMDVPKEVMDKPTRLGGKEVEVQKRMELILLTIDNAYLNGTISSIEAKKQKNLIREFLEKLDSINSGRPLSDDEVELIDKMSKAVCITEDGQEIPYLTDEESEELHIKTGTLSDKERMIMQSHVIYTDKILSHMKFGERFNKVRTIAINHHETLNGMGYPKGIEGKDIDMLTRVLTVMDIFDSLIAEDRPYKKPKSVKVAFEILEDEAKSGRIDKELVMFAKELFLVEE